MIPLPQRGGRSLNIVQHMYAHAPPFPFFCIHFQQKSTKYTKLPTERECTCIKSGSGEPANMCAFLHPPRVYIPHAFSFLTHTTNTCRSQSNFNCRRILIPQCVVFVCECVLDLIGCLCTYVQCGPVRANFLSLAAVLLTSPILPYPTPTAALLSP